MEKKKQVFRDILINGLGGIVTSVILFVYGKISGSISFEASSNIYKVIAGTLYIALSGLVVYVFRAKRPAIVSPQHLVSKFSDNQKKWAGLFGFAVTFVYIWFLFFKFALEPSIIPPLVINLVNSSKEDVILDATVEFELLEGARVTLGTTTATGVMDLIPAGSEKQEFITIPAESSLLVGGYFRQPERLLPIMEKGNTDIMLRIYKGGGGIIINMNPFRFDKGMLEKYRMDLEVSQ